MQQTFTLEQTKLIALKLIALKREEGGGRREEGKGKTGMPLGKYYCDYCDKQFQDTPFHRKRHIQGLHHQKAKALWYASIPRDPNQISLESSAIGVCNRFIRTLAACRVHAHMVILVNIFILIETCKTGMCRGLQLQTAWKPKCQVSRGANPLRDPHYQARGMVVDRMGVMLENLPPSLRPPPENGYPPLPFVDWG
ncbi:Zinc finger, U1-C type [Cynara cardunculus var. scolymus]|uniref:Zinc finger, U1-C type n=1 Tax=Cynara cardunculus var. scolymus TaxID=59895 RepID=A0A103YEZ1_CYNCS|nr:Zinc finger, U1-C type [Cynara cardunculus var. scolymus]